MDTLLNDCSRFLRNIKIWVSKVADNGRWFIYSSAIKVSNYVSPEQLEFFHTIPLLSYVRFAKWDKVFSYERPDDDFKFSNSIFNYALSVAHAANGNILQIEFNYDFKCILI